MIKRSCFILLSLLLLLAGQVFAVVSINRISFSAVFDAGDITGPAITHSGLSRISNITKFAVFKGTATDDSGISKFYVNYYYDNNNVNYSTKSFITSGVNTYAFSVRVNFNFSRVSILNYRLEAVDAHGNVSYWPSDGSFFPVSVAGAVTRSMNGSGGRIFIANGNPDDGETAIDFPAGAIESAENISITELDPLDSEIPPGSLPAISKTAVAVYRFEPSGTIFKKPVKVSILFSDEDRDGIVDGTNYPIASLRIMWWDGFDWRILSTTVDQNKALAIAWAKHFSYYAVFPAGALTDDDYRPKEKIITPVTIDGFNDFATFGALGPDDTVNLFDIRGRRIRQLKNDFTWDGRDDEGRMVESGIYIYQIKVSGRVISGTIAVAK